MTKPFLDSRLTRQFGLATVLVTAALGFFGTGLTPVWWLTWLLPLPALVLAPRVQKLPAFLVAFAGYFFAGFTWWTYLHRVLGLPISVFALAVIASAIVFGLGVLLTRSLLLRDSLWRAALAFPVLWVSYEFLNARMSPHSTFGNLAYSQMNFLPVVQVASVAGIWGIDFLLCLFPAALAALLTYVPRDRRWTGFAFAIALFFVAVIAIGSYRVFTPSSASERVNVGLLASDTSENVFPVDGAKGLQILRSYADQVAPLAAHGAQTIVLPEKIATVNDAELPQMDELFQSAATKNRVNVVVGIDHQTSAGYLNEARLYSPDGRPITSYVKHHLIPGIEGRDRAGSEFAVLTARNFVQGLAICKDMDFPSLGRHYGRSETALLLVPAWDFNIDRWLHGRMAVLRGVEEGFTIARSAKQGLLTISDDRGRILADKPSSESPFSSIVVVVPVRKTVTLYSRWGDWFAWANLGMLIVLIASAMTRKEKFAKASSAA